MGLAPYNGTHPLGNINQFHVIIDTPKIPDLARHEQAFVRLLTLHAKTNTPVSYASEL